MKSLTVFTPTYNRKHTLYRTYESLGRQTCSDFEWLIIDDGSTDGTREWVKTLGDQVKDRGRRFDWMGRMQDEEDENSFTIVSNCSDFRSPLTIHYIYKENGGLYTGYNTAYASIQTELCVCVDSDDYMPDDAVEKIVNIWKNIPQDSVQYAGLIGLDYDVRNNLPIGGRFPDDCMDVYVPEISQKKIHAGDTKMVFRTDLMKCVSPMIGFCGEKNFNPHYMALQVGDKYRMRVVNENFCWVEYQIGKDSMSQGIFQQYFNSTRSFAKFRIMEMQLKHNTLRNQIRVAIHYVTSCIINRDRYWLQNSPKKLLTLMVSPVGVILYFYLKRKM